jgi:pyridoxine kinase
VENLTIIGSTATSDYKPRLFRIDTPQLPLFFSGTGDMFAALTIPRLIEAVHQSSTPEMDLHSKPSWRSPDDVPAEELPLAKACQKVLASMQAILAKTTERCKATMEAYDEQTEKEGCGSGEEDHQDREKRRHLALMNASEVKVVRHVKELLDPPDLERFTPKAIHEASPPSEETGNVQPDQFGVLKLGLGKSGEGAVQVVGQE